MDSSTLQLSHASMNNDDNDMGVETFQTNDAILMSLLLEEFQEEHRDDEERVSSLMQSLEAEIASPSATQNTTSTYSGSINSELTVEDLEEDGNDCSGSSCTVDSELGWFDVEQVPCSPSEDMMNWYMDSREYEMDCPTDSGIWVSDYSHICYEASLEDNSYSLIWEEAAYDSIMYD